MKSDERAAYNLSLSLRRLLAAFRRKKKEDIELERRRSEVVKHMGTLLEEFGLLEVSNAVLDTLPEFDGRHLEDDPLKAAFKTETRARLARFRGQ